MAGERRIVTILFCDVKGSTAAAERLDPEEWTEIINGAFEHMIRPVYKYEGTLARLMGDAILAFFGAPIAHEDDPQRAVLAGLDIVSAMIPYRNDIKEKWGIEFDVRVGINTGMVVVGAVGNDLRMEYTAMGDAVNLASRMEQMAAPGTVQIAHDTYKLVAPLFDFEDLGEVEIKGKAEPVNTYRVLRPRETPGKLRGFAGSSLPLVGREDARGKLSAAIDRVLEGNGQIITITGDMGLGKSRLITELHEEWRQVYPSAAQLSAGSSHGDIATSLADSRWFETFSLSYQTTSPYSLFRNLIRQASGSTASDPPAALAQKLSAFISATAPTEQQDQAAAVLDTLFGLNPDSDKTLAGEKFKNELFESITNLVSAWAGDKPGVIFCDDIQWSDPASMELLVHLFKLTDRLPILFVNALRPDRGSPGWGIKAIADGEYPHRYTEIQLDSLSHEESRTLVSRLLNNDGLPDFLQEDIFTKAAGNPFFTEEIVREMMENGSVLPGEPGGGWQIAPTYDRRQTSIPDSLQSMLTSRIDRLDEAQKGVLQLASVIGPSFYYRVLAQVCKSADENGGMSEEVLSRHLDELQRRNLIVQIARHPELEYVFRQTLVHESAYETILHRQRRLYHRQVGEAMELLFPEQLDEQVIVLAHHFTEAGDDVRSLKYNTLAADTAYRLYANTEAVAHYSMALTATKNATVTVAQLVHLFEHRGRALELDSRTEDAAENYETMRLKALELASREMELAALMPMMTLYSTPTAIYDFNKGSILSQQALEIAQELANQPAEAKILWNLLNMNRFAGRTPQALEYGEQSLAIARDLNLREQIAYCLNDLCHSYNRTGRYDKSKIALEESTSIWRDLGNLPMLADSLSTASYVHNITGDYDEAIVFSEEAHQISVSIQNTWGISYSQWLIGLVYWQQGDVGKAIRVMEESIDYAKRAGFVVAQVYTRTNLALLYAELGAIDRGLEIIQEAVKFAKSSPLQLRSSALAQMARLCLRKSDVVAAEEAVEEIQKKNHPVHINQPDMASMAEIELFYYRGDYQNARQLLEERLALLRNYSMKADEPETAYLLGKVFQATGQPEKAIGSLEDSLKVARSMAARWWIWQILAALAELTRGVAQAAAYRAEAVEIVQLIAGKASEVDLDHSFLERPEVQELLATHPA
jgi:predicted ATPase/class 3 adenylate cyclase